MPKKTVDQSPTWNIAFEISPILAASGIFGDKSGVYRINYNLIYSLSQELLRRCSSQQIYLYTLAPHLIYSKNLDFAKLITLPNVHFIAVPYQTYPTLVDKEKLDIPVLRFFIKYIDNFIYYPFLERLLFARYIDKIARELKKQHVKIVVHSESGHIPMKGFTNVIHVNDLVPIKFPFWLRHQTVEIHKRKLRFARRHCQGIICISEHTKKDLISYHALTSSVSPLPPIRVIYLGGNLAKDRATIAFSQIRSLFPSLNLQVGKYFLYFGTIEPRKNLVSLVSVFSALKAEGKLKDFRLILVGGRGWGKAYDALKSFLQEHYPVENDRPIVLLDFIGDIYLRTLIKNAYSVVYPSHYEGFGLPILESMEYGVPVITSNTSSMPEVGGNACLYVDPTDPLTISDAILKLAKDPQEHDRLAKNALTQAKNFSWTKCAQETYDFFVDLLKQSQTS